MPSRKPTQAAGSPAPNGSEPPDRAACSRLSPQIRHPITVASVSRTIRPLPKMVQLPDGVNPPTCSMQGRLPLFKGRLYLVVANGRPHPFASSTHGLRSETSVSIKHCPLFQPNPAICSRIMLPPIYPPNPPIRSPKRRNCSAIQSQRSFHGAG